MNHEMDEFAEKAVRVTLYHPIQKANPVASVIQPPVEVKSVTRPPRNIILIMDTLRVEAKVIVTDITGDTVIDTHRQHLHILDVTIHIAIHQVVQMKMRMKLKGKRRKKWKVKRVAAHLQDHLHHLNHRHPVQPVIHLQVTILTLNMNLTSGFIQM